MKNKLTNLNDHLFSALERLNDDDLTPEQVETEAKRAEAIVAIADPELKPTIMVIAKLEHKARQLRKGEA